MAVRETTADGRRIDPRSYTRLPGRGRKLSAAIVGGDRQTLYLGTDHILAIRRSGYDESAKRFFLADIQSISVQSNGTRAMLAVFFGLLLSIFGVSLALAFTVESVDARIFLAAILGGLTAFFAVLFSVNLILGPTCTVNLHTAVQVEQLTALSRIRTARKCLAILVPRIRSTQETEAADAREAVLSPTPTVQASANARDFINRTPPQPLSPRFPLIACSLMLMYTSSATFDLFFIHAVKNAFDALLYFVLMCVLMVTVVRQNNSTLPSACRWTNWIALGFNAASFMIMFYIVTMMDAFALQSSGEPVPFFGVVPPGERPAWIYYINAGVGAVNAIIAFFGFASLRGYRLIEARASGDADPT